MGQGHSIRWRLLAGIGAVLLASCAGTGANLQPGVSTAQDVLASMGQPSQAWKNPDGSEQLAFVRGPAGTQTYMAYFAPDGKLQRLTSVLDEAGFAKIQPGMTQDQVRRLIGPSIPDFTVRYPRTGQTSWTWLYCAPANFENYFDVYFDTSTGKVVKTGYHPVMLGREGIAPNCMAQVVLR